MCTVWWPPPRGWEAQPRSLRVTIKQSVVHSWENGWTAWSGHHKIDRVKSGTVPGVGYCDSEKDAQGSRYGELGAGGNTFGLDRVIGWLQARES